MDTNQEYVLVRRDLYNLVEKLVDKVRNEGKVETERHWQVVETLFKIWVKYFPREYKSFYKQQRVLQGLQKNKFGSVKEGGAEMQHVMEMPKTFHKLLKAVFQKMEYDHLREEWITKDIDSQLKDKKFVIKLLARMPIMKIPDKV